MKRGVVVLSLAALLGVAACKQTRPIPSPPNKPYFEEKSVTLEEFLWDNNVSKYNSDTINRTQDGRLEYCSDIVKESVKNSKTRSHVEEYLKNFRVKYEKEELPFSLTGSDSAEVLVDEFRKDISRDMGDGHYTSEYEVYGQSIQTLPEFLSNDYSGDCDDFAMALQTYYESALDITDDWGQEDEFWKELHDSLEEKPIYYVLCQNLNTGGYHAMNVRLDTVTGGMEAIEPQIFFACPRVGCDEGLYIYTWSGTYKVMQLFDTDESYIILNR